MTWMTPDCLQPPHPVQRRGWRQPDQAGQLHVGTVSICLQLGEQLQVNFIKFNGHVSKYYLVQHAAVPERAAASPRLSS